MDLWLGFRIGPFFIGLATFFYAHWLTVPGHRSEPLARGAFALGALSEIAGLIVLSIGRGVAAPAGQAESLLVLSAAFALLYLYVEKRAGEIGMGVFAAALSLVFALGAASRGPAQSIPEVLREHLFAPHANLILLSFASFTMSAVLSLAYVVQYRRLRSKRVGGWADRLPALEVLDRMTRQSTRLGVVFLGCGLLIGMMLAKRAWGTAWNWDPKQCLTLLTWLLYFSALLLRRFRAWQGGRVAVVNLAAFATVIFGLGIIYAFFTSAHSFG